MYSRNVIITKLVHGFDSLVKSSESIGDVLITVNKNTAFKSEDFCKRLRSLQTNVLSKLFDRGLKIVTRSNSGRLHCHAAVSLNFKTDGFDWTSFDQAQRWHDIYFKTKERSALKWYKYYKKLYEDSMPDQMKVLNLELKKKARKYGFGHIFILPVRKNTDSLKWYLVKNVPVEKSARDKEVRYYTAWGDIARTGVFKVLNSKYNGYRRRLRLFAQGLHLKAGNYNMVLKDLLGPNWHWKCRNYITYISASGDLPACYKESYVELGKTVKQYLLRRGEYE